MGHWCAQQLYLIKIGQWATGVVLRRKKQIILSRFKSYFKLFYHHFLNEEKNNKYIIYSSRQESTAVQLGFTARSGSANYKEGGTVHKITQVVVDPNGSLLGVFKVSPSLEFSKQVSAVRLPQMLPIMKITSLALLMDGEKVKQVFCHYCLIIVIFNIKLIASS